MLKEALNRNRLPMLVSVAALAVSLSHGWPEIRTGHAADPQVTPQQKQTLASLQDAFSGIADSVEPAVVGIHVESAPEKATVSPSQDSGDDDDSDVPDQNFNPFGNLPFEFRQFQMNPRGAPTPAPRGEATGSGVIVQHTGNDYYILTNYHVVEGGSRIRVQLNGVKEEARATLVGKDARTDLAVVKVRLTGAQNERRVAQFANSDNVKVGQWAIAIGNPLDVGQTLTVGVVSAKGRSLPDRIPGSFAEYSDMIQTDASINPGNSGGALLDINGNVIGINTAIASPTRGSIGIGFAIPSNTAKEVANQLIRSGEVVRGWLGVQTTPNNQEISPAIAKMFGVDHGAFVDDVVPNSPASKAGIQSEDIITRWGDTPVTTFQELSRAVSNTPPGQDVRVTLMRDRKEMTVTVHTEKRADEESLQNQLNGQRTPSSRPDRPEAAPQTVKAGGLSVRALTSDQRQSVGSTGVVVTAVDPGSAAAEAGIPVGAVIQRVNETPIHTPSDFKTAMASVRASDGYVLRLSLPRSNGTWSRVTLSVPGDTQ